MIDLACDVFRIDTPALSRMIIAMASGEASATHRDRSWQGTVLLRCAWVLAATACLATQLGCPPNRQFMRTRTIELSEPLVLEPVIVEHLQERIEHNSQFREARHRFSATRYTLKTTDGRKIEIIVGDAPVVVVRDPADGRSGAVRYAPPWSDPQIARFGVWIHATELPPTTQEVRP